MRLNWPAIGLLFIAIGMGQNSSAHLAWRCSPPACTHSGRSRPGDQWSTAAACLLRPRMDL
jgi:hypothetical protein